MFVAGKIEETYLMRTDKKREECKLPCLRNSHSSLFTSFFSMALEKIYWFPSFVLITLDGELVLLHIEADGFSSFPLAFLFVGIDLTESSV